MNASETTVPTCRTIQFPASLNPDVELIAALAAVMDSNLSLQGTAKGRQAAVAWFVATYGQEQP
jgi:hypothetical protein